MTADHLLSLADLHAAAPGVLDVVFGPDGDFEGAPRFLGPVWDPLFEGWDDVAPRTWVNGPPEDVLRMSLDLRVPSVANRLAGLCARAMGAPRASYAAHVAEYEGAWWLRSGGSQSTDRGAWAFDGRPLWPDGAPTLAPVENSMVFLRSLTLALAPRIAALRPAEK